jgi:hypothetical protein
MFTYSRVYWAQYRLYIGDRAHVLSPWSDVVFLSAITLAVVPITCLCGFRLIREAFAGHAQPVTAFSFAAQCGGLYGTITFVQALVAVVHGSHPAIVNLRDAVMFSVFGGAIGGWCGFALAVFLVPIPTRQRASIAIAVSAAVVGLVSVAGILIFGVSTEFLKWWALATTTSAFIGASIVRIPVAKLQGKPGSLM